MINEFFTRFVIFSVLGFLNACSVWAVASPSGVQASTLEANSKTNGLRDDVDAYIAKHGYTESQLKSVQQTAKALAAILLVDISSQDALKASDLSLQRSIRCLYLRFSDMTQAQMAGKNIEKVTVNSKVRVDIYLKYLSAMDGKVQASPQGDTCD